MIWTPIINTKTWLPSLSILSKLKEQRPKRINTSGSRENQGLWFDVLNRIAIVSYIGGFRIGSDQNLVIIICCLFPGATRVHPE